MTTSLIHMANHLDASTEEISLNYVLLGHPHHERAQHHPSYMDMIKGAIQAIDNGTGSSKAAILKYIAQNYHVGENLPKVNNHLRSVLKKAVDSGDIEQTRGHGATGSFRMGKECEKNLQVGIPVQTKPMLMLKEVRQKLENISKAEKTKPSTSSMSTNKKGKPISTMKKRGVMSKKRSSKNKMAPKAKSHGLKKKGPATKSSGLVHKAAGAKNEAAPTTKMELRTGTRKSYC
ncbi:Histone H1.X [Caenorhabditis elegans]|uniref:Histone H1.X n=1 Tax=Caenorhabditis elegans TaxID=6239 RepID=H1X_CAEEL|nr:Histone H1.X [Caenorhabditis elegans]Q18336.1 RecName: Full=Histone H1.X; AltName: Full=Histone H1-like protein 1 [Caenorhabditis elegans]AAB60893.1 histone H1-like protein [Caenorhabditis elegans]CAB01632.1 Histone H1.X [Caenorhabditis elegans]|eukprot:NP_506680.1 Histone H1.X [Caenorhabditis elegans]